MTDLKIDLTIQSGNWADLKLDQIVNQAVTATSQVLNRPLSGELSLAFVDNAAIQTLNRNYRDKDKPTNVLSFPSSPPFLGDIVLAEGVIVTESNQRGIAFTNHLTHLIIHGFLHLLGYDHQTDLDSKAMEALEIQALEKLNIDNPYEILDR